MYFCKFKYRRMEILIFFMVALWFVVLVLFRHKGWLHYTAWKEDTSGENAEICGGNTGEV